MKQVIKNLMLVLMFTAAGAGPAAAGAYVKLVADTNQSDVYVNHEVIGTYEGLPLEFILPKGNHLVEIRKDNGDGSFQYYKKTIKAGSIDVKVLVDAKLATTYPESYYFKRVKTPADARTYLEKFPQGKYKKKVTLWLDAKEAKAVDSVGSAKAYLAAHPKGKFRAKVTAWLDKEQFDAVKDIPTARDYLTDNPKGKYRTQVLNRTFYLKASCVYEKGDSRSETRYQYDAQGHMVKKIETDLRDGKISKKTTKTNEYEQDRLIRSVKQENGEFYCEYTYQYDGHGQRIKRSFKFKSGYWGDDIYQYDFRGNRVGRTSSIEGRLDSRTKYQYDENNRKILDHKTDVDGGETVFKYRYDSAGRELYSLDKYDGYQFERHTEYDEKGLKTGDRSKRVRDGKTTTSVSQYSYNARNLLVKYTQRFSDGIEDITDYLYDAQKRKTRSTVRRSDGKEGFSEYEYDANGNNVKYISKSCWYKIPATWTYAYIPFKLASCAP